ncbi:MAG: hypothetical protein ACP5N9_06495 [Candidatus Bilamarchaeum sp.]|jgi:hypothetical protein
MIASLDSLSDSDKERVLITWKNMSEIDKGHFINQVAIALSVLGSDEVGRKVVLDVLKIMSTDGTKNLSDFGLYLSSTPLSKSISEKVRRACTILDGYRVKNALSSEPHRDLAL